MAQALYRGYSSVANKQISTSLFDLELVVQDLLNHFNTRIGERVGRPKYGSIIWDLLFDPSDSRTEALVVQDAQRIIQDEPRVELLELLPNISIDTHTVELKIRLKLVERGDEGWFTAVFKQ